MPHLKYVIVILDLENEETIIEETACFSKGRVFSLEEMSRAKLNLIKVE